MPIPDRPCGEGERRIEGDLRGGRDCRSGEGREPREPREVGLSDGMDEEARSRGGLENGPENEGWREASVKGEKEEMPG